ncbi:MAG: CARDB domain-containing protein [Candidatus Eisenbacteria bacterium]
MTARIRNALLVLAALAASAAPAHALANLYPAQRGNWSAPVVPRFNTVGSTFFDPVTFEPLYGDSQCVLVYVAVGNNGPDDGASAPSVNAYVDGVQRVSMPSFNIVPAGLSRAYADCAGAIAPGLHTVTAFVDATFAEVESDENDNWGGVQVAMIPRELMPGGTVFRLAPPNPIAGQDHLPGTAYPNQDGVRIPAISTTYGTWSAIAMRYAATANYDLRLYDASTSSDNGFRTPLVTSTRATGQTDALFVNHAKTGLRTKDVGILYVSGTNSYALEHRTSTMGASPLVLNNNNFRTFPQDQMVMVEEFLHVPSASMPTLRVTLQGPVALPFQLMWAYGDSVASTSSLAAHTVTTDYLSGLVTVDVPVPTSGPSQVLGLFLVRDAGLAGTAPFNFTIKVEAKSNLSNATQPGWIAPIGVGNASASLTAEPATLNAGNSVVALGWKNDGIMDALGYTYRVYVDGAQVIDKSGNSLAIGTVSTVSPSLGTLAGGRHTVSYSLDATGVLNEFSETDNRYGKQWVWAPTSLGSFASMPAPPDPQGGWSDMPAAAVKRDNLATSRVSYSLGGTVKFGTTMMMPAAGVDLSLAWYVPGGPTDGLQTLVQSTNNAGDRTEALFARGVATSYDAAVRRESGVGGYSIQTIAGSVLGTLPLTSATLSIPANRIGVLYGLNLPSIPGPGGSLQVLMENLTGNADLAMALVPATGGPTFDLASLPATYKADAGGAGASEALAAGTFAWDGSQVGLLVYKTSAAELAKVATFRLVTSGGAVAGVGDALPRELAFALSGANPVRGGAQLRLDLPNAADASVVLYDVTGRAVRTLASGRLEAGTHHESWDLRDEGGATVGSGVYFAACRVGAWRSVARVMVVR